MVPFTQRVAPSPQISALLAVLMSVTALSAWSLLSVDRASAQSSATTHEIYANYDAPALFAVVKADRVELSWTFDASSNKPPGWTLAGFQVQWRITWKTATSDITSESIGAGKRSHTHVVPNDLNVYWSTGARIDYSIRARYASGSSEAFGKEDHLVVRKVDMNPKSATWVAEQSVRPQLTVSARPDGVMMGWSFYEIKQTPPGWMLEGFRMVRLQVDENNNVVPGSLTYFQPDASRDDRGFKDPWNGVAEELRLPGAQAFQYTVFAHFSRLSDGLREAGPSSQQMFTAPSLPKPIGPLTYFWSTGEFDWWGPNLSWSANSGFNSVSGYQIFRNDSLYLSVGGAVTRVSGHQSCDNTYKMRALYGIFFSEFETYTKFWGC